MDGGKEIRVSMSSKSKGNCDDDEDSENCYRIAISAAEKLLKLNQPSENVHEDEEWEEAIPSTDEDEEGEEAIPNNDEDEEEEEAIPNTDEEEGFIPTTNEIEMPIKIEATETLFDLEVEEPEALDLNTMGDLSTSTDDPLDLDTLAVDPLGGGEDTVAQTLETDAGTLTRDPGSRGETGVNSGSTHHASLAGGETDTELLLNTQQEHGEGSGSQSHDSSRFAEDRVPLLDRVGRQARSRGSLSSSSIDGVEEEQESFTGNAVEESISFSQSIYEKGNEDRGQDESQQSMSPVVKMEMEVDEEVYQTGRGREVQELDEGRGTKKDWRYRHKSLKDKLSFILKTPGMRQDVAFIVGLERKRILAHSFILWLNSPVFANWLGEDNHTTAEGEIDGVREVSISDVEPKVFDVILKFIYTEKAEIREDNVIPVYEAAKKQFMLNVLSCTCTCLMKKWLRLENVVQYFKLAEEYNEVDLFDQAKAFIMENANLVFNTDDINSLDQKDLLELVGQDDLGASELTIFQMLLSWAANRCFSSDKKPTPDHIREALGPLIYKIRFPLLSAEDFKVYVIPSNILRPQEVIQLFTYFTPPFDKTGSDFPFETNPRRSYTTEAEADTTVSTAGIITVEESSGSNTSNRSSRRNSCRSALSVRTEEIAESSRRNSCRSTSSVRTEEIAESSRRNSCRSASSVRTEEIAESSRKSERQKRSTSSGKNDENTDDEWNKSSSADSDSDSSDEFIPSPHLRRQVQKRQHAASSSSQASASQTNKKMKLQGGQGPPIKSKAKNRDQPTVEPSNINSKDLSLFIMRLTTMDPKCLSKLSKIQEDLIVRSIPQTRLPLPNLTELELNLTTLRLGKTFTMREFKEATVFYLKRICSIIFVDSFPITPGSDNTCLDSLWHTEMRVNITFHGVTVLKSNPKEGELTFSYLKNAAVRSITEGLALSRHPLKKLVVVECDFRMLNLIPSKHLTHVVFLKAHGLQGINSFLRMCPNLQELHWDGSGVGSRIINLDEDLHIFSPTTRLKVLVISNVLISLKKVDGTLRPSQVRCPRFYFCEFSPIVMNHFHLIFPFLGSIHFRNYPALKFFESILDMPYLQFAGIWGAKLLIDVPSDPKVTSFTTYLTQKEVKAKIKLGNIANKMGKFVGNAFFLGKKSKKGGPPSEVNWEVSETIRNLTWSNEVLNVIYQDFEYKSIVNFARFKMLFHTYY